MATHPYHAALDEWRRQLRAAFADPDAAVDFGEQLVWAVAAVAEHINADRKDRLRNWARDIKRRPVLPRADPQRLVAAGLRYHAVLTNEAPVEKPKPATPPPPPTRDGSLTLATPLLGLPGIGEKTAAKLAERGLTIVGDILYLLP